MGIKDLLGRSDRCVYCLEFPNGMKYVGKTGNLGARMRIYLRNLEEGTGGKVCDAIREYGWDAIKFSVLASLKGLNETDLELCLSILEIRYIRDLDTIHPRGYNVSLGGEALRIPPEYITTDKEAIKAFKEGSKAVLVYDLEGNFLKEYESLSRMDYELGLNEKDYSPFLDKKKPVCDKYYLRSKRYNVIPQKIEVPVWVVKERVKWNTTVEERVIVKESQMYGAVPALAYDMNGDFVGEYKNRAEASRMLTGVQRMEWGKYYKGYILFKKTSEDYPKKIEGYLEMKCKALGEEYKPLSELEDLPAQEVAPRVHRYNKRPSSSLNLGFPIEQVDYKGNIIATFDSIRDASEVTGIQYSQIYNCVKGTTRSCHGYIWRKVKEEVEPPIVNEESLF